MVAWRNISYGYVVIQIHVFHSVPSSVLDVHNLAKLLSVTSPATVDTSVLSDDSLTRTVQHGALQYTV